MELLDLVPSQLTNFTINNFDAVISQLTEVNQTRQENDFIDCSQAFARGSSIQSVVGLVYHVLADYHLWLRDTVEDEHRDFIKRRLRRERNAKHLVNVNVNGSFVRDCLRWLCPNRALPRYHLNPLRGDDNVPWALVILMIAIAVSIRKRIQEQDSAIISKFIPDPQEQRWRHPSFFKSDPLTVLRIVFNAKEIEIKQETKKYSKIILTKNKNTKDGCHPLLLGTQDSTNHKDSLSTTHQL